MEMTAPATRIVIVSAKAKAMAMAIKMEMARAVARETARVPVMEVVRAADATESTGSNHPGGSQGLLAWLFHFQPSSPTAMKFLPILTLGVFALASICRAAGPADLIRLYEEEILAHDLYVALAKKHPEVMPLQNIPRSERMHRDALAGVLKAEGIALPTPPKGRRFVSEGLDGIFAKWRAEGKKSAVAACRVGVRLEDHDIVDLRKAQIDFPKHREVLAQLEAASNNHLRAFQRNLKSRGGSYTPEALSAADYKEIVNGENDCGPDARGCGPGNGKGWRGGR